MDTETPTSVPANTERNRYMGSCKAGSAFTAAMIRLLPTIATRYMVKKGMDSQPCWASNPGIPVRKTDRRSRLSLLLVFMSPIAVISLYLPLEKKKRKNQLTPTHEAFCLNNLTSKSEEERNGKTWRKLESSTLFLVKIFSPALPLTARALKSYA